MDAKFPESFHRIVGELPEAGHLTMETHPYETVRPARSGFVDRAGVKLWYAVWGESGPWIAFAPIFQIVHTQLLKTTVPWLSQHFRVVTMDSRGNGRSDRPEGQAAYGFDTYYQDFVAVLDAAGADKLAMVGISVTAMTALRLAAEHPERVTHLIIAGGFAETLRQDPKVAERVRAEGELLRTNWPEYLHRFFLSVFESPADRSPFITLIRSAVSHEESARLFREFITEQLLGPIADAVGRPDARLRASLVGSQMAGMVLVRYVIRVEPLASADPETVVRAIAPTVQRYLTGDIGLPTG